MNYLDKIKNLTNSLSKVEDNLKKEYSILEFVLEDSTDGYWDWDIQTNYEYLSPNFKAQFGYTPDEMENSPESWQKIIHKDDLELALKLFKEHVDTRGEVKYELPARYTHKDGHEVTVLCKGSVIDWDEEGNPLRMIGTHTIIKK